MTHAAPQVELNKDGKIEVTEETPSSPTELDQAVAQAFERAANEAAAAAEAAAEAEAVDKITRIDPVDNESPNETGNGNLNEESTAEVSTREREEVKESEYEHAACSVLFSLLWFALSIRD